MAELLEDQLGLVHGWLMSVPCKVIVQSPNAISSVLMIILKGILELNSNVHLPLNKSQGGGGIDGRMMIRLVGKGFC